MDDRSPEVRSRTMAAVRSTNTTPERRLRSALHRQGVRFRLGQVLVIDGRRVRPDIVWRRARLAVFVDGCFWHGCGDHCRMPGSNVDYWNEKIARNQARDHRLDRALRAAGWRVLRVWEHEDPVRAARRLRRALDGRERSDAAAAIAGAPASRTAASVVTPRGADAGRRGAGGGRTG